MMSWYDMMGQDANMYLALVSGYLMVAYSIGDKKVAVLGMILRMPACDPQGQCLWNFMVSPHPPEAKFPTRAQRHYWIHVHMRVD